MRRGELPAMTALGVCSLSRSPHSAEQDLQTTPRREGLESLLFVLSVCLSFIYHLRPVSPSIQYLPIVHTLL